MNTLIIIVIFIARLWTLDVKVQGQKAMLQADFQSLTAALQMYKVNAGVYPSTKQGLKALVALPDIAPRPRRWTQIMMKVAKDPWGREYQYKLDGEKVQLWSKGANIKDPKDDIHFPPKKVVEQVEASDS